MSLISTWGSIWLLIMGKSSKLSYLHLFMGLRSRDKYLLNFLATFHAADSQISHGRQHGSVIYENSLQCYEILPLMLSAQGSRTSFFIAGATLNLSAGLSESSSTQITCSFPSSGSVAQGIPAMNGTGDSNTYSLFFGRIGIDTLHHFSGRISACRPSTDEVKVSKFFERKTIDLSYNMAQNKKQRSYSFIRENKTGQNHSISDQTHLGV